ncbi:hypothetical protein [Sciscionella sediminilitoris]|uniref:hypothetical protein n=1 Tax=Sciscionella sediminilitoris TaxID=1445613 RepID=UPI0004DF833B|nr:hypothetical protein [Sciscionella sp. SE31]
MAARSAPRFSRELLGLGLGGLVLIELIVLVENGPRLIGQILIAVAVLGILATLFFVLRRSARAERAEERQSKAGAEEVERWLRDQT